MTQRIASVWYNNVSQCNTATSHYDPFKWVNITHVSCSVYLPELRASKRGPVLATVIAGGRVTCGSAVCPGPRRLTGSASVAQRQLPGHRPTWGNRHTARTVRTGLGHWRSHCSTCWELHMQSQWQIGCWCHRCPAFVRPTRPWYFFLVCDLTLHRCNRNFYRFRHPFLSLLPQGFTFL